MKNPRLAAPSLLFHIFLLTQFLSACGGSARTGGNKTHPPTQNQNHAPKPPSQEVESPPKVSASPLESPDPSDLETILFNALNRERRKAGLRAVTWSKELASVARAYSEEMARTGIVAHVSKLSGSPSDRLKQAQIQLPGVSENLAKAGSAAEAHLGLMASPGHRANILDQMAAGVGVGVAVITRADNPIVMVTQLFSLKPKPIDAVTDGDKLIAILNRLRREQGLKPFRKHPWLTQTAAEISAVRRAREALYAQVAGWHLDTGRAAPAELRWISSERYGFKS